MRVGALCTTLSPQCLLHDALVGAQRWINGRQQVLAHLGQRGACLRKAGWRASSGGRGQVHLGKEVRERARPCDCAASALETCTCRATHVQRQVLCVPCCCRRLCCCFCCSQRRPGQASCEYGRAVAVCWAYAQCCSPCWTHRDHTRWSCEPPSCCSLRQLWRACWRQQQHNASAAAARAAWGPASVRAAASGSCRQNTKQWWPHRKPLCAHPYGGCTILQGHAGSCMQDIRRNRRSRRLRRLAAVAVAARGPCHRCHHHRLQPPPPPLHARCRCRLAPCCAKRRAAAQRTHVGDAAGPCAGPTAGSACSHGMCKHALRAAVWPCTHAPRPQHTP